MSKLHFLNFISQFPPQQTISTFNIHYQSHTICYTILDSKFYPLYSINHFHTISNPISYHKPTPFDTLQQLISSIA